MTGDILDLIDAAVRDWDSGPDAVRYNGPQPTGPTSRPVTASSLVCFGPPRVFIGAEEITVTAIEFDTAPAPLLGAEMFRAVAAFEQRMLMLSTYTATFTTALANATQVATSFARALGLKPCDLGVRPCFCHPAPNPAARDYRRRAKHRNRRRRR